MTTINDIGDLVRVLQEQPQWAEALRSILLSRELLELPERFARFVDITERFMDATAQNFEAANQRFDGIEHDLAEFKAETSQRFDRVGHDLAEFKAETTQRFDAVDQRFDAVDQRFDAVDQRFDGIDQRFDGIDQRFDGIDQRLDAMDRQFDRMDHRFNQADGRMDKGFGTNYEIKVDRSLPNLASQFLNLGRAKVLIGSLSGRGADVMEKAERATEDGIISWDEFHSLQVVDLIFTGRRRSDQTIVYAVAEVSITAGDSDVQRSLERGRILGVVIGETVLPVVISDNIGENQRQLAERHGVEMIHHPQ